MTTAKTIANALAYVAITGEKKRLHIDTRVAILDYTNLNIGPTAASYVVTDEGMALARTTKLWAEHERLTAMGFEMARNYKQRPSLVRYVHPEQVETPHGKAWRMAWTGTKGDTYVDQQNDRGYWVPVALA